MSWLIPFVIWLGSSALNVLFWMKTPEQWEAFCLKSPRLSGIVRLLRAIGFDLPRAIRALQWITKGYRAIGIQPPPVDDINSKRKA